MLATTVGVQRSQAHALPSTYVKNNKSEVKMKLEWNDAELCNHLMVH
jgi:hypothetical protein